MNQAPVFGLSGGIVVAVIAGLLFIEEVGVPLFLTPGDLLLALGGVAIASGQVTPLVFVPVAFAACALGGVGGWEVFAHLGPSRAMAIASKLHVRGPVERVAVLLRGGGWRAVFVARLVPGLRICTTQVAAISGMARSTFLVGLVAANVVYITAFIGLGAALGHPVIGMIQNAESRVLWIASAAALCVAVILLLRVRIQRFAAWLELNDWRGAFLRRPSMASATVIPFAIGVNYSGHALAEWARLPLFLDSAGTVLAAVVAGPWIGGISGALTNLLSASTIDSLAAPYSAVSLVLGFSVGLAARRDWTRPLRSALIIWAVCFVVAVAASAPLDLVLNHGHSGIPLGDGVFNLLAVRHVPSFVAAATGEAAIDLPDKLLTVALALGIVRALQDRVLVKPTTRPSHRASVAPRAPAPC